MHPEWTAYIVEQYRQIIEELKLLFAQIEQKKQEKKCFNHRAADYEDRKRAIENGISSLVQKIDLKIENVCSSWTDRGSKLKALTALYFWCKDHSINEVAGLIRDKKYPGLLNSGSTTDHALTDHFNAPPPDISGLPPYSFLLRLKLKLVRPYISKDDDVFHIHENPVRRDRLLGVPMVSPSSWKGHLRWAATKLLADDLEGLAAKSDDEKNKLVERRCRIIRLFGTERGGIEEVSSDKLELYLDVLFGQNLTGQFRRRVRELKYVNEGGMGKGRLHFYATFFKKIGLEVINPHDRRTKAGTVPVNIESAPKGEEGYFTILYAPLSFSVDSKEVCEDWDVVLEALQRIMKEYGFSAKRTSGYGLAEIDEPSVSFQMRFKDKVMKAPGGLNLSDMKKFIEDPAYRGDAAKALPSAKGKKLSSFADLDKTFGKG